MEVLHAVFGRAAVTISDEALTCLKKTQIEQHRRTIAQIQITIADFDLLVGNLNIEISAAEVQARNHDPTHFAYPTFAKAAIKRRDNLKQSIERLKIQSYDAAMAMSKSIAELAAVTRMKNADMLRDPPKNNSRLILQS
jgi:protein-tyrosine-phosphatase